MMVEYTRVHRAKSNSSLIWGLSEPDHQLVILLANSTFEGTFYFSQAPKAVDIPHQEEKNDLFCGIFPHFLNSPTLSKPTAKPAMRSEHSESQQTRMVLFERHRGFRTRPYILPCAL